MGHEFLVTEQIEAGAEFIRDFNNYKPVSAAFWIKPAESDIWYLHIASSAIDDTNFDIAYGEVLRIIKRNSGLDPFRIKLVKASDPMAQEAMEIRDRYFAPLITHYHGSSLGGEGIDGAYIYSKISEIERHIKVS